MGYHSSSFARDQAESARAAAEAAEAARQAQIAALRATIAALQMKLSQLITKLNKYVLFKNNLISLNGEVINCSSKVEKTYEYARNGMKSPAITPKFDTIDKYSRTLKENNSKTEVIIEDVKRKISEIEVEIQKTKKAIEDALAALAALGG